MSVKKVECSKSPTAISRQTLVVISADRPRGQKSISVDNKLNPIRKIFILTLILGFNFAFCQDKPGCTVYLIRPGTKFLDSFLDGANVKLKINDTLKLKLKYRTYIKLNLNAGVFKIDYQEKTIQQTLEDGKTYYFSFFFKAKWRAILYANEVPPESGQKEMTVIDNRKKKK